MIESLSRVMRRLNLSKVSLTNKPKEKPHYVYSYHNKRPIRFDKDRFICITVPSYNKTYRVVRGTAKLKSFGSGTAKLKQFGSAAWVSFDSMDTELAANKNIVDYGLFFNSYSEAELFKELANS